MWRLYPRRGLQLSRRGKAFHFFLSSCLGSIEQVDETLVAGTFHLFELGAILIDLEGGHALDSCFLGGSRVSIYVDLLQHEFWKISNFGLVDGSNSLARRAPGGGEIDNERFSTCGRLNSSLVGCKISEIHISMVCHRESLFVSSFNIINS